MYIFYVPVIFLLYKVHVYISVIMYHKNNIYLFFLDNSNYQNVLSSWVTLVHSIFCPISIVSHCWAESHYVSIFRKEFSVKYFVGITWYSYSIQAFSAQVLHPHWWGGCECGDVWTQVPQPVRLGQRHPHHQQYHDQAGLWGWVGICPDQDIFPWQGENALDTVLTCMMISCLFHNQLSTDFYLILCAVYSDVYGCIESNPGYKFCSPLIRFIYLCFCQPPYLVDIQVWKGY